MIKEPTQVVPGTFLPFLFGPDQQPRRCTYLLDTSKHFQITSLNIYPTPVTMIEYNGTTPCKIVITLSDSSELLQYQRALFAVLRIPVSKITPRLKEDIKIIFKLLSHLECKSNLGQLMELEGFGPEATQLLQELHDKKRAPATA